MKSYDHIVLVQKHENFIYGFEPKWSKNLKSDQVWNVNELLKGFQYFYQKVYIEMELRVQRFLKLNYGKCFRISKKIGL